MVRQRVDDFETINITVSEVNQAPVLAAIGNKSIDEGSLLTFTASATDPDLPANNLSFSLDSRRAGWGDHRFDHGGISLDAY